MIYPSPLQPIESSLLRAELLAEGVALHLSAKVASPHRR